MGGCGRPLPEVILVRGAATLAGRLPESVTAPCKALDVFGSALRFCARSQRPFRVADGQTASKTSHDSWKNSRAFYSHWRWAGDNTKK
jgi:hypothetical protein